jgi:hypothetical protein
MKTHTVSNKKTATPMVTLTPEFFDLLLKARPESASYTLNHFKKSYLTLTGNPILVNPDQQQQLLERFGADEQGIWKSQYSDKGYSIYAITQAFQDGLLKRSFAVDMDEVLRLCEDFYSMVDLTLAQQYSLSKA